jgi:hypothetical protein
VREVVKAQLSLPGRKDLLFTIRRRWESREEALDRGEIQGGLAMQREIREAGKSPGIISGPFAHVVDFVSKVRGSN